MAKLRLDRVSKRFGDVVAVNNVDLALNDGEFFVLLGPSGCGKTTTLRLIAGLDTPSDGQLHIGDRTVTRLSAGRRNIGMVFQSYALYPHLSVRKNLLFGSRIRHEPRAAADQRSREIVKMLGLEALLDRRPAQLSGGQRQRVALGRALMRQPDIFLMDEPLSNLDAALRADIREELIRLHRAVGVTTVYVTHDQLEAISMADRLGVMFHGDLVQVGTPQEVFNRPVNLSVAKFLGAPPMNTFDAVLTDGPDGAVLSTAAGPVPVPRELAGRLRQRSAQPAASWSVIAGVRPDDVRLVTRPSSHPAEGLDGTVDLVETLGAQQLVSVKCGQATIRCRVDGRQALCTGDAVCLVVDTDYLYLFDPDTQEELTRATPSPGSPGHADEDPMPSRERGLPFGNGAASVSEVSAAGDSGMAGA